MNRSKLIKAMEEGRESFLQSLDGLNDEQLLTQGVIEQWSVKDIIFHLTMWEAELVKLLWQASQDLIPVTAQFSQGSLEKTNAEWTVLGQERLLDQVWDDFHNVRGQTIRRLNAFSEKDLEDPARFSWLKGQALWKWIAEDTFKHEAEHAAEIRFWREKSAI